MIGKLRDQHFAFIQLLRMVKPGILTSGQTNYSDPLFFGFHDEIITVIHRLMIASTSLLLMIHSRQASFNL
ncbi:hypothetical protein D3C76_1633920 [compost metagenome]